MPVWQIDCTIVSFKGKVGNYQEIYDRNIGADSALNIERGMNALWNQGGAL